jgi:large subunit ribosomal protein L4
VGNSAEVVNIEGGTVGVAELPEHLFDAEVNEYAVYSAVVAYETHQRQGTASTKTRSEVRRTGRKHHRQKGTGQARRGTAATNLLRGGGVAFGPKPRTYSSKLTKQLKKKALSSALSLKCRSGRVKVIQDFEFPEPSTKSFFGVLGAIGLEGEKVLFVTPHSQTTMVKSCRNIPGVEIRPVNSVSTYDVVLADTVLLTERAVAALAGIHSGK